MGEDMGAANLPVAGFSTLTAMLSLTSCAEVVESSVDTPPTYTLVSSVETAFFQPMSVFQQFPTHLQSSTQHQCTRQRRATYPARFSWTSNQDTELIDSVLNMVRKETENRDFLQCFQLWHFLSVELARCENAFDVEDP